jgi:hypothetical protein
MKAVAGAIVILAGSILASAATIGRVLLPTNHNSEQEPYLTGLGGFLLIVAGAAVLLIGMVTGRDRSTQS